MTKQISKGEIIAVAFLRNATASDTDALQFRHSFGIRHSFFVIFHMCGIVIRKG